MDTTAFDRLARQCATAASRRALLGTLIGLGVTGVTTKAKGKGTGTGKSAGKQHARGQGKTNVRGEATCTPGHGQTLSGCNFTNQDLVGVDCSSSTMKGTTFRGANLTCANLRSSQLKDADFRGFADPNRATILYKTDLSSSGCSGTQFNSRSLYCGTKLCDGSISNRDCPSGLDPQTPCCGGRICAATEICDQGACHQCDVCASGCTYSTVQDAVAAASAGATLYLCPGTYKGATININKNLTLVGAGSGSGGTVLNGSEHFGDGHVLANNASVVTLRDLTISGMNAGSFPAGGIHVISHSQITLTRVQVTNNRAQIGAGIFNDGAVILEAGTLVSGNTATNADGGGIFNQGTVTLQPGSVVSGNTPNNCVNDFGGTGCP